MLSQARNLLLAKMEEGTLGIIWTHVKEMWGPSGSSKGRAGCQGSTGRHGEMVS